MTLYAGETVGFEVQVLDRDNRPSVPLPASVTVEVLDEDEQPLDPPTGELAMTLVRREVGTASGGSARTLEDDEQAWATDAWRHAGLRLRNGAGAGQERRIRSNTATVLTIDHKAIVGGQPVGDLAPPPDATTQYDVHEGRYELNWLAPEALAGRDLVAVFRATRPDPDGFTAASKLPIRLEPRSV